MVFDRSRKHVVNKQHTTKTPKPHLFRFLKVDHIRSYTVNLNTNFFEWHFYQNVYKGLKWIKKFSLSWAVLSGYKNEWNRQKQMISISSLHGLKSQFQLLCN